MYSRLRTLDLVCRLIKNGEKIKLITVVQCLTLLLTFYCSWKPLCRAVLNILQRTMILKMYSRLGTLDLVCRLIKNGEKIKLITVIIIIVWTVVAALSRNSRFWWRRVDQWVESSKELEEGQQTCWLDHYPKTPSIIICLYHNLVT